MKIHRGIAGIAIAMLPVTGLGIALTANNASALPSCSALQAKDQQLAEELQVLKDELSTLVQEQSEQPSISVQVRILVVDAEIAHTNAKMTDLAQEENQACGASGGPS